MSKTKDIKMLVKKHPNFELLPGEKIRCILNNHEIAPNVDEFQTYLKSKGYKRLVENSLDFKQFEPYLIEHKQDSQKLFCTITKQVLNKKKTTILNHVNGKRYQALLKAYQEQQAVAENEKEIRNKERAEVNAQVEVESNTNNEERKKVQKKKSHKNNTQKSDVLQPQKIQKKIKKNPQKSN